MSEKSHIIVVLLENEFGALSRVANLFSARGYNIETLNVAPTPDPTLSRMTITTIGSERILEQITKQLNKLIDVVDAYPITSREHHTRECALLRLAASSAVDELIERWSLSDNINLEILDQQDQQYAIAVTADTFSLERLIESIDRDDVMEISRSGALAVDACQRSTPEN